MASSAAQALVEADPAFTWAGRTPVGLPISRSEWRLYRILEGWGVLVVPQAPIGPYTVDFLLPDLAAVIEVDGEPYHSRPDQVRHDRFRDGELQALGFVTIHVWSGDLFRCEGKVRGHILRRLHRARGWRPTNRGWVGSSHGPEPATSTPAP